MRTQCTKDGCSKPIHGRGFCGTHYRQVQRSVDFKSGRPVYWGVKTDERQCKRCRAVKLVDEFPRYEHTCKKCKNENWKKQYPVRRWYLMQRYGITPQQLDELTESQGGKCAICKMDLDRRFVDHDHKTGKVRGVLCNECNKGLGCFKDNAAALAAAVAYLRRAK